MVNNEFLGQLLLGLGAIIGVFIAVGNPILKLNTNVVKLNVTIENLKEDQTKLETEVKDYEKTSSGCHKEIEAKITKNTEKIATHDTDITMLKEKVGVTTNNKHQNFLL